MAFIVKLGPMHPQRDGFMGRSRRPLRGRVWSPTPLTTFRLLALG
jgi:hypothetical protein